MDDLARDSGITPADHAAEVDPALLAYAGARRLEAERGTVLEDLVVDLHHYADTHGLDWQRVLGAHDRHYFAEIGS